MNWLDVTIAGAVALGLLFGAQRGLLRQGALMAGFYLSLVLAARYYGPATELLVTHLPQADRAVASAYTLAGITLAGTLARAWISRAATIGEGVPGAVAVDRVTGAGLGVAWSWAVVAFALTVLLYSLSFSWGVQEPLRQEVGRQVEHSRLVVAVRGTLPTLQDLLSPWLPGGLPAPLSV